MYLLITGFRYNPWEGIGGHPEFAWQVEMSIYYFRDHENGLVIDDIDYLVRNEGGLNITHLIDEDQHHEILVLADREAWSIIGQENELPIQK